MPTTTQLTLHPQGSVAYTARKQDTPNQVSDGHRALHHPLDGLACQASLGRFLKPPNDARHAQASVGCFTTDLRELRT
ncbi:hypothetical protein PGT21_027870 [Puccinia graminis f. sp. tritici]|uniref:Uncharacterized protein n=1 Tax=Puccinia graminis f. sp. tritici TaxID=56615 RepID=A0A5B0NRA3_PUCGR|nr:hypothetical protein PGT21_027870 [Puccinia graminis f. sp. tritici]